MQLMKQPYSYDCSLDSLTVCYNLRKIVAKY